MLDRQLEGVNLPETPLLEGVNLRARSSPLAGMGRIHPLPEWAGFTPRQNGQASPLAGMGRLRPLLEGSTPSGRQEGGSPPRFSPSSKGFTRSARFVLEGPPLPARGDPLRSV